MSQQFFDALLELDMALQPTRSDFIRGQGHHHAYFQRPEAELEFALRMGDCSIWYCFCDGGYSRFLWDDKREEIALSDVSIEPTKSRFKVLVEERERVNQLVREALKVLTK